MPGGNKKCLGSTRKLVWSGVILLVVSLHWAFSGLSDGQHESRQKIISWVNTCKANIQEFRSDAHAFEEGKISLQQIRESLTDTRLSYKKVEFILTYYYPEHCQAYINGAPLDHPDPYPLDSNSQDSYYPGGPLAYLNSQPLDLLEGGHYLGQNRVVKPVGLQVLDEWVFSDEAITAKKHIRELADELVVKFAVLNRAMEIRKYTLDWEVLEASRLQLVRIFTLGITGFDTPGSLNAIAEAKASLESMQELLPPLFSEASASKRHGLNTLLRGAVTFLEREADFEQLDRLYFLKEFINPIYKVLGELGAELSLPTSASVSQGENSWNPESINIFAEDFLNPYYYVTLRRDHNSDALRKLGKRLFYEKLLSRSGAMSCSSCHRPELAFSDGMPKSSASEKGKTVQRNSPGLLNAVFADRFFYDLRAFDLQDQAAHVVGNHLEFNTSFEEIIAKLNGNADYQNAFAAVYGVDNTITRYQFSEALASYVMSLVSLNSPFDRYVRGEQDSLDPKARQGFNLFMGKAACGTCHFAPTFSGLVPPLYHENESEVLGVLAKPGTYTIDGDMGRVANRVKFEDQDIYRNSFKTVTVRNATLTAPYFHNGAYSSLEEVIDFYDQGGAFGLGLEYEVPHQTLPGEPLGLTENEKEALLVFLEALTDSVAIQKFK